MLLIKTGLEWKEEMAKAKYTKRWRGKNGKWHYEYPKPLKSKKIRSKTGNTKTPKFEGDSSRMVTFTVEDHKKAIDALTSLSLSELRDKYKKLDADVYDPHNLVKPSLTVHANNHAQLTQLKAAISIKQLKTAISIKKAYDTWAQKAYDATQQAGGEGPI